MVDGRKKAVSLRLSVADIRRVKQISRRLGVRDSDVIRFAIKGLLYRLSPLSDPLVRGRALVPLFLESGADLLQHFDLDAQRLGDVVNEGAQAGEEVSLEDLHLLAMSGRGEGQSASEPGGRPATERRSNPTRRYLYDKYLYKSEL
jgi:hypothetical protein